MQPAQKMRQVAGSPSDWVETAARIGYATKGVVYALIGGLAIKAALGSGGSVGGGKNAIREIGSQPFGQALLIITAIGLFGYALWRFIQAGLDPENQGTDKEGIIKRIGYAASGVMHTFLGITAVQMVTGGGGGGGDKKTWLAKLLAVDVIGPILAVLGGLFVLGYAAYQIRKGWQLKFKKELKTSEMSQAEEKGANWTGRIGLVARGVVFAIVGGYLVKAAVSGSAGQAKTVGDALGEIASASYGAILLAIVAFGLLAYAVLQMVMAKYRRFPAT